MYGLTFLMLLAFPGLKSRPYLAIISIGYVAAIFLFSILFNVDLLSYYKNGFLIISGFEDAMYGGIGKELIPFVVLCYICAVVLGIFILIYLFFSIKEKKKNNFLFLFVFNLLLLIYITIKQSIIRGHLFEFPRGFPFLCIIALLLYTNKRYIKFPILLSSITVLYLICFYDVYK